MLFLSAEDVERLAAAIRQPYATLVYLLAYGGLWGEAVALRRKLCDILPCKGFRWHARRDSNPQPSDP